MKNKVKQVLLLPQSIYEKYAFKTIKFVIISNNCWGYEIYKNLKIKYNTPFVGVFLYPKCYLKLLENFPNILNEKIDIDNNSMYHDTKLSYPVGHIRDIEIHFMHYDNFSDAKSKWDRRVERLFSCINDSKIIFKFCDNNGATENDILKFHSFKFDNKISFSKFEIGDKNNINLKHKAINGASLFKRRYYYFDLEVFLNEGKIKKTIRSELFKFLTPIFRRD